MPKPLLADNLAGLPGIAHGFFTRHGGVSQGIYASLNCGLGSRDDRAAVKENRARVAGHLGALHLITAHQAHTAIAIVANQPWEDGQWPTADAIVTTRRGLAVGALAADCTPVLFADARAGVVAAAHAGWRGAIGGILEATVAAMERLGASKAGLRAAVGPCIGSAAYEVGPDFERDFCARDAGSARYFSRPTPGGRPHFDLAGYVASRLERAGVSVTTGAARCTHAQSEDFFSYRRSQARKEPDYGRQISAIVLT